MASFRSLCIFTTDNCDLVWNDLLKIGTEEPVGPLKSFLINLDEGSQMILGTKIIIGSLWIAGLINSGWSGHDSSPPKKTGHLLAVSFFL